MPLRLLTMKIAPRRLALKLILSLTIIVILVAGISGYVNVRTQERQLLAAMILGADQLSKGITSATWHAVTPYVFGGAALADLLTHFQCAVDRGAPPEGGPVGPK